MTLSEVEILMQELTRHINDHTQILFGTAVDGRMGNRLTVTLISSLSTEGEVAPKSVRTEPTIVPQPQPLPIAETEWIPDIHSEAAQEDEILLEEELSEPTPLERPLQTIEAPMSTPVSSLDLVEHEEVEFEPLAPAEPPPAVIVPGAIEPDPPQPRVILPAKKPVVMKQTKLPIEKIPQAKQEVLQFESVTRGRFEKSEPTIVEGQDLDVPTFLRKNVRVK
jgi:cell division protein FtsZ